MRKNNVQMMAVTAIAAMLLGGCGDVPYELTKEEEGIVVNYSAHVLAKYNKYQKDGLTYVLEQEEEVTEEAETEEPIEEAAKTPDTETENAQTGAPTDTAEPEEPVETAALQDIFGTDSLKIHYVGARIADSYVESDYYALNADDGKLYLIVEIDVSNTSDADAELNVLDSMAKFVATVNADNTSSSEFTILTEDFSTYKDTIAAGETTETVLLFQIPDTVDAIDSLDVKVTVNGNDYQIILESTEN